MLKRITADQVLLGMYIESLEGSWLQHPFWKTRFLLREADDVAALRRGGAAGVWIDTSKGRDLPAVDAPAAARAPEAALPPTPAPATKQVDAADEMQRAAQVLERSKQAVVGLFNDARMGKALEVEHCLEVVEDVSASVLRNASALISLARLKTKDEYTYLHSVSVCALMVSLAQGLKLDEAQTREAGVAGLLHDVGKMLVPEQVLNKPGRLSDDEFTVMKLHPTRGHELLLRSGAISAGALDVCLHHHEKMDGSGYPHRLQGEQISQLARMGAVCDVYDAITSERPYKQAWRAADSLSRMAQWAGHFDQAIFHAFVRAVGIYPLGTLVRLESQRLAVVIDQRPAQLTRPLLRVFFSAKSKERITPLVLDLSDEPQTDRILGREDPTPWGFGNLDSLWRQ
ncbi:MAG TPA: HD-GYP domain-containing protein [Burkholderiaceae bacterium]